MNSTLAKFVKKYPAQVHAILALWGLFMMSWATGVAVPLTEYGIPFNLNAREAVSWLQLHTHIPTDVVSVATFAINAMLFYSNWKKKHPEESTKAE